MNLIMIIKNIKEIRKIVRLTVRLQEAIAKGSQRLQIAGSNE